MRAMQTVQVPSKRKKNNTGKQNNRQNRQRKKNTERNGEKSNCNTARWKLAHQRALQKFAGTIPTAKKKVEKSARTVANAHPETKDYKNIETYNQTEKNSKINNSGKISKADLQPMPSQHNSLRQFINQSVIGCIFPFFIFS